MGESSGNPRAYNGSGNDASYGLWQINMIGSLGPARRAQFGLSSNEDLFDPATNARVAVSIYNSSGWGAWGAYTNGSYKRYMTGGGSGSDTSSSGGGLDLSSLTSNLPSLPSIPTPFGDIPGTWILIALAAYLLMK
jgi:hypothetical protein